MSKKRLKNASQQPKMCNNLQRAPRAPNQEWAKCDSEGTYSTRNLLLFVVSSPQNGSIGRLDLHTRACQDHGSVQNGTRLGKKGVQHGSLRAPKLTQRLFVDHLVYSNPCTSHPLLSCCTLGCSCVTSQTPFLRRPSLGPRGSTGCVRSTTIEATGGKPAGVERA